MAKKKKDSGMAKPALGLVSGVVILGAGSSMVSGIGGPTAGYAGAGLTSAASFMPPMGAAVGAGLTVQQLKKLQKQTKQKQKY